MNINWVWVKYKWRRSLFSHVWTGFIPTVQTNLAQYPKKLLGNFVNPGSREHLNLKSKMFMANLMGLQRKCLLAYSGTK